MSRFLKTSLLLGLALSLTLSACAPAAQRSVSFMVFGDPVELKAFQGVAAAFEAANPGYTVKLTSVASQGDYYTRLTADYAAGTPADVVVLSYRRYAAFAARGALEPVQAYLDKSTVIHSSQFYAEALAPYTWNGQLTCLPMNISSLVVYYNRALFKAAGLAEPQAGWTWDDFLAAAHALTLDTNGDGQTDQYGLGVDPQFQRLIPFIWQNNGQLADDDVAPEHLAMTVPSTLEALQWFVDLQVREHVTPDAAAAAAEDPESRFLHGTEGMFLQSRRVVPALREVADLDWDVAPLPQRQQAATILHSDGYCMSAATKDKAATWKFIEFANSVEGQKLVAATGRTVPSLKAVAESDAFLAPDLRPAHSQVFLDVIPFIRAVPVTANWADAESAANKEVEAAFYGKISVQEAAQNIILRTDEYFEP